MHFDALRGRISFLEMRTFCDVARYSGLGWLLACFFCLVSNGNFRDATCFHDVGFLSLSLADFESFLTGPAFASRASHSRPMATQVWTQTQDIELWSAWSLGQAWSNWSNREDDLTQIWLWCLLALAKVWKSSSCCRWPWSLCWPSHSRGRQTAMHCQEF